MTTNVIHQLGAITALQRPPDPLPRLGSFTLGRTTALNGLASLATISWDDIIYDDNLSLSGPVTTVTVPTGASYYRAVTYTRFSSIASGFYGLQLRRNGAEVVNNNYHNARYNTSITCGWFNVSPGDTVSVTVVHDNNSNGDVGATKWSGDFYA